MTPARWRKIEEIYFTALSLPPSGREAFLNERCAEDRELLIKIQKLLAATEKNDSSQFLEDSLFERGLVILDSSDFSPLIGEKIARYTILKLIGKGGMGEVFLAEDERLNRKVALKILPVYLHQPPEITRRFQREARLASQISHQNVAHIYDIGEDGGRIYIAMEYIEGESLRARLAAKGRLPVGESLKIAAEIASALASAHRHGIVHRDIKPENLVIRADGSVKVLDFGLARLIEGSDVNLKTSVEESNLTTEHGLILGTARYMSPEQSRGQQVGPPTDVWSLGVVLFEMLAGRAPFDGATRSDIIAEILKTEARDLIKPDARIPPAARRILEKALHKEPAARYQNAAEMQSDIEEALAAAETDGKQPRKLSEKWTGRARINFPPLKPLEILLAIIAFLTVAALIAADSYFRSREVREGEKISPRFRLTQLTNTGRATCAAVSPDARQLAYCLEDSAGQSLWVKNTETGAPKLIVPPSEDNDFEEVGAAFSPDGSFLYYGNYESGSKQGTLYRVSLAAENPPQPEFLLKGIDSPVSFSPDGSQMVYLLVKDEYSALLIARPDGSEQREIVKRSHPQTISPVAHPSWSPDGQTIAFAAGTLAGRQQYNVVIYEISSGREIVLTKTPWFYIKQTGWLADGGALMMAAAAGEGETAEQFYRVAYPSGEVTRLTNDLFDYAITSVARKAKNKMAAIAQSDSAQIWTAELAADDAGGGLKNFNARQITWGKNESGGAAYAPADGRIVFSSDAGGDRDIWIMDHDGGNRRQLTNDPAFDNFPAVSGDNRFIVFSSARSGAYNLWRMNLDGSELTQLTGGTGEYAPQISRDGRWVVFHRWVAGDPVTVWKVPLVGGGTPIQLIGKGTARAAVSPDSRFVAAAYKENPDSPNSLLIAPLEASAADDEDEFRKIELPRGSRYFVPVRWSADGRSIVYVASKGGADNLWSLSVVEENAEPPRQLTNFTSDRIYSFDLSVNGKQTVLARGKTNSYVVMLEEIQ
jgi:eukaryotic-like serine/threonine-protein kinase